MQRKVISLLGITVLLFVLLGIMPVSAAPAPPDYKPVDVGPDLRAWEATPDRIANTTPEQLAQQLAEAQAQLASTPYTDCVIDTKIWMILKNDFTGQYQLTYFHLIQESDFTQIWVQANLAWPAGDPRPIPEITCEQAAYLMGEFDNNIYPKEAAFFGPPDAHDGSLALLPTLAPALGLPADYYADTAGRQVVLVSNVRDDNYYDPTYPNYIAGFYSPTFEIYFDRNIMSIDAYDWANRVGPDGTRPYLYEGIFAHEYQHLLHDDYDPDEETFVNEGLADFAMIVTGYDEAVTGHLEDTADLPENSLVVWEDQGGLEILADYGQAFLFQYYMNEQFGSKFIQAEFRNPDNGITGVNSTLDMFRIQKTFGDVYHQYIVAGLIDETKYASGIYGFRGLNFKFNIGTPALPNPEAFSTPGAPPWGTDFIWLNVADAKNLSKLVFNGVEYSVFPTAWTVDNGMLFSGTGDLLDNWAIFETPGGGTLSFDTIWDLEDFWDFGFVQVSTDGGNTWTSLSDNEGYSTSDHDPNAHPKVIENLPGLTSFITDPVHLTYDLGAYAGQNILVAFRLVTDWSTYYGGWWVDNVMVDNTLISDGTDASVFKDITDYLPINNNFTLTFVGIDTKKNGTSYQVLTLRLGKDEAQNGIQSLKTLLSSSRQAVMLVTYDAPNGVTSYADYTYDFVYSNKGPKK